MGYIAIALLVASSDAMKLNRAPKVTQPKTNILAQLMQPSADDIMAMFDSNKDGEISRKEFNDTLKALAKEHNYKPSKDELKEANDEFDKADADGSGTVNMDELAKALAS